MATESEKQKSFLEGRMMAHALSEDSLIGMLSESMKQYTDNGRQLIHRHKAHQVMMLLTMKWGDMLHNRNSDDIIKDTERLERISAMDKNMTSVDDILNPDKDD